MMPLWAEMPYVLINKLKASFLVWNAKGETNGFESEKGWKIKYSDYVDDDDNLVNEYLLVLMFR